MTRWLDGTGRRAAEAAHELNLFILFVSAASLRRLCFAHRIADYTCRSDVWKIPFYTFNKEK